jgi:hypothetical protein
VEGIPAVPFGGMFTIGCFREWLADRQRLEHILHDPNANEGAASSCASSERVLHHDTETRRRRADASYCRKKRFLKKIEIEVLKEEVERLRQQNQKLKEEEARLERCLIGAHSVLEAELQRPSRVMTSLPLHGDHERAAIRGSILPTLTAPYAVSSGGQVALNESLPFRDPRLVGRSIPSSGWVDRHSSFGPETLFNTLLGAPSTSQLFLPVRPSLSVPPSHYTNDHLLRTLVGPTTNAMDPLPSLAAQTLHAQPFHRQPLSTTHLDRSSLQVSHERTDRYDLQQLLVQRLLNEPFPPRDRDA